jgi:hypothetical protein
MLPPSAVLLRVITGRLDICFGRGYHKIAGDPSGLKVGKPCIVVYGAEWRDAAPDEDRNLGDCEFIDQIDV